MDSASAARALGVTGDRPTGDPGYYPAAVMGDEFDPLDLIDGPFGYSVAVEDFDQDGNLDALIADLVSLQLPRVHYGDGDGGFDTHVDLAMFELATTAHVNDDCYPDIVGFSTDSRSIIVQFSNGDRTFAPPIHSPVPGYIGCAGIASGYLNNDLNNDIVLTFDAFGTILFLGDGSGTFTLTGELVTHWTSCVGLGDLNDDGKTDLVVGKQEIEIYLNNGQGEFALSDSYGDGENADFFSPSASLNGNIIDFNEDGHADIVASLPRPGSTAVSDVVVLFGDGQGGIISSLILAAPGTCYPATMLDLNRDGHLDIVSGSSSRQELHFFYGDGAGGILAESTVVVAPFAPAGMATGDFREDGQWDLLIGNVFASSGVLLNLDPAEAVILDHEMRVTTTENVRLRITDPSGLPAHRLGTCIAGARRHVRSVLSAATREQTITNLNRQSGVYAIDIWSHSDTPQDARYSVDITIGETPYRLAQNAAVPQQGDTVRFLFPCGDQATVNPAPGSFILNADLQFDWDGAVGEPSSVLEYEFQIADQWDFSHLLYAAAGLDQPHYTLTEPLADDSLYYWRFRGRTAEGWSDYSPAFPLNLLKCQCACHADPLCDGGTDLIDIVMVSDVAFRGLLDADSPDCPVRTTDVDCSGATDVIDVVRLVNIFYRHAQPETEICKPCE